jgi:hypothetical protein
MKNVKTIGGAKKVFRYLSKNNDYKFLLSKSCEELTELQEVLLKMSNKIGDAKPPKQHLIEEIGDVETRLLMLKKRFRITQKQVNDRKIYKANKFIGYLNEGKYKKNI